MLARWRVCANSALWLRAALSCLALAVAPLVACGGDPTPAATFLLSEATPSTVEDYGLLALEYRYGAAEIDKLIEAFSEAISLDPNDAGSYVQRGTAYAAKYTGDEGEFDKAIRDLNEAIRLESSNPDAYIARGNAYDRRADYALDGLGEEKNKALRDYDVALQLLDEAISLNANDIEAYVNRANVYRSKGEYEEAIQDYGSAIRLDANNAKAYFTRGLAYLLKGEHDRAIEDFGKSHSWIQTLFMLTTVEERAIMLSVSTIRLFETTAKP